MKPWMPFFALLMLLAACKPSGQDQRPLVESDPDPNSPAAMVRIPLTPEGNPDMEKLAVIEFDSTIFRFGIVDEGTVVEHTYGFTNTGKTALILYDARSSCGCTVPEFPKEPIPPGETGRIMVRFNTDNKTGQQVKTVTIKANTFPAETKLTVAGEVIPKK